MTIKFKAPPTVDQVERPPKPYVLEVDADGIPEELKQCDQWVLWRHELRKQKNGTWKWTKVPKQCSGTNAAADDPATWSTFDAVWSCYASHRDQYDGVGYVFSKDDPYTGVDLDACRRREDGVLTDWSAGIIADIGTYAEVSPSAEGVKLVVRASLRGHLPDDKTGKAAKPKDVPTFGDKAAEVAMYDTGRFWCLTGQRVPSCPASIESRQDQVDALFSQYFGINGKPTSKPAAATSNASSNGKTTLESFIEHCRVAKAGDRSERDYALCAYAIEHRLDKNDVWRRVHDVGKFAEGGRRYFDTTWSNAESKVKASRPLPANDIPVVVLGLDEGKVSRQTLAVLATVGWNDDKNMWLRLYQRGGQLVHVTATVDATLCGVELPMNMLRIRPLPAAILRERIASAVRLYSGDDKDGEPVYVRPPAWLVKAIHERGQYPRAIRPLTAIVRCPTLRPDGTVLQRRGYDDRTGLLYVPDGDYPPVPDQPTRDDATHAATELLEVVTDFPFKGAEHRSVWLAMVLTMVGRSAIRGPCPMFVIDANCPGTGKSLLTDIAGVIAYGDRLPRKPWPGDDDAEIRKVITSVALEGLSSVLWDNVGDTLGSSSLDAALTGTAWTDRLLGSNTTTGTLPLLTVWSATGNNLVLAKDTPRRVLYSRLETDLDQPEERRDFQHDNLVGWVRQHRHRLATHAVTILRAFAHAGFPNEELPTWGSFEAWSDLIRNAITWSGLPDPWETRSIVRQADHDMELLGLVHAGIDEANQAGDGVTSAEIVQLVGTPLEAGHDDRFPHLRAAITEICGTRIDGRKVGNQLRHFVGRVKAGRRLSRRTAHGGSNRWFIERVPSGGCGGTW